MAKSKVQTPARKALAQKAQAASAAPAVAEAIVQALAAVPAVAPAPAKQVALRGGPVVATIALSGTPYRTGAPHNAQWWATLCAALAQGPAPVANVLLSPSNTAGVPAHFVGYAIRRGYLVANPANAS